MSSLWQMPAVIVFLAAWLASPPAGLADVAQREAFRRLATQKSQATLTNLGLPAEAVPPAAVSMPSTAPPPSTDPAVKAAGAAAPDAKPDPKRDEGWWRGKMTELRNAAAKDQLAADTLQTRINRLQADAANLDDPLKQTKARMDLVTAMDQLDKMKAQIDADHRAISALQEEARRLSVPAGWIR
jgi:septal ring factor EnvC (AmiA/AmiB activator)